MGRAKRNPASIPRCGTMCLANARLILRRFRTATVPPNLSAIRSTAAPAAGGRPHPLSPIPPASWPPCGPSSRDAEEAAARPAAARRGAVAPIAEQIALRLRHIGVALRIGEHAPLLAGHPQRKPPSCAVTFRRIVCFFQRRFCSTTRDGCGTFLSPLRPSAGKGAGRTNERRGQRATCPPTRRLRGRADAQAREGEKPFSRRIVCARGLSPRRHKAKATKLCLPRKEGSGAPKGALSKQCPRQARPRALLSGGAPPFGAHACGTRHRLLPRWLSPRTGFPATH